MHLEKLSVCITFKNVESCCPSDLKASLSRLFKDFEDEVEGDVSIDEVEEIELVAHHNMPIDQFMSSFLHMMGLLVEQWDKKMATSELLNRLGQAYATITRGVGWIAGYMESKFELDRELNNAIPLELNKLMEVIPVSVMRVVAQKMGIAVTEEMTREQILEAVMKAQAKPEAEA